MNIKNGLISIVIVAVLTLCVPNVVAASASKQITETHSSYATDIPVKDQPILVLLLSNNVTQVDNPVDLYGGLATYNSGNINGIVGETIHIQRLNFDGTAWNNVGDLTTMSGNFSGFFVTKITPQDAGAYIYRATFDGDNNYEPAISNWVDLRAYS